MKLSALPQLFSRFWWMILFGTVCYGLYVHGMQKKREAFLDLKATVQDLEKELQLALNEREELCMELRSRPDPEFTEMLLKKRLGMVPEGQIKVFFEKAAE